MTVFFVLTSYDNAQQIRTLAEKFLELAEHFELSLAVAVSSTGDGTEEYLRKLSATTVLNVDVMQLKFNVFWAQGMRLAINRLIQSKSMGELDVCVLMNEDTNFIVENVMAFLTKFNEEINCDILVGDVSDDETGEILYGPVIRTGLLKQRFVVKQKGDDRPLDTFNCNFVACRANVIRELGGFRSFEHAYADFDFGLRASKVGYRIKTFSPSIARASKESARGADKKRTFSYRKRLNLQDRKKFFYSHYPWPIGVLMVVWPSLKMAIRGKKFLFFRRENKSYPWKTE